MKGFCDAQESEARSMFQQLLLGLDYFHKMRVANWDIKLENVLISGRKSPAVLKLTDFRFCKNDRDSIAETVCGTLLYMGTHLKPACWNPTMPERRFQLQETARFFLLESKLMLHEVLYHLHIS